MNTRRIIRFEYCISLIFLTLRRESEPIVLESDRGAGLAALPYCLITLLLGWWGVPWGLLLTPVIIWNNLAGGREVTQSASEQPSISAPGR
jgi:hypothetical protein